VPICFGTPLPPACGGTGSTLDKVAAALRHRSTDTTMHYAKVDIDMLEELPRRTLDSVFAADVGTQGLAEVRKGEIKHGSGGWAKAVGAILLTHRARPAFAHAMRAHLKAPTARAKAHWRRCIAGHASASIMHPPLRLPFFCLFGAAAWNAGDLPFPSDVAASQTGQRFQRSPKDDAVGRALGTIILNWNRDYLLKQCVESCLSTAGDGVEPIIVDNQSTGGSIKYLHELERERPVNVIRLDENIGGEAFNRAIPIAGVI
jgi:Glycosyl transferase family 2